jgi:hypothetical protein
MSHLRPLGIFLLSISLAGAALVACVDDSTTADGDAGTPTGDGSAGGHEGGVNTDGSSGNDSSSTTDSPATTDSGTDSNTVADTAPPTVTCTNEALGTGAFWHRCTAAAPTLTPGGNIQNGNYLLTSWYDTAACGIYEIGYATVFTQGSDQFMRFIRHQTSDVAAGPQKTSTGTMWLQATPATGDITRTELCDAVTLNIKKTGKYQQTATTPSKLYFQFSDHTETWDLQ